MNKIFLLLFISMSNLGYQYAQTVTDIDGNVYDIISIGSQKWFKQDLNVTHYLNGDSITIVKDSIQWCQLLTPAYCNYNNLPLDRANYGRLYNWYVVNDNRKVCPYGWHVSTDNDWNILINYLGGATRAGGKLKETGTSDWQNPNTGADNSSGFTALPGGRRGYYLDFSIPPTITCGVFEAKGIEAIWWSTLDIYDTLAFAREIDYSDTIINRWLQDKKDGYSIRCICDTSFSQIKELIDPINFIIFHNPAFTNLTIEGLSTIANAEVYDLSGKLLLTKQLKENQLDISSLAKGLYFIKLTTSEGSVVKKFVKE